MARARVSDRVHDALRRDILEGGLSPGDPVPSERVLAEEHGVNRHAVREALKRLEQAGLVQISQGGATRVLDWRESGGLDVLLDLLTGSGGGGAPPAELARSVLEMRESVGVDAARRCAQRAPAATRDEIARLADETAAAVVSGPPELVDERYGELWLAVVHGSGNLAYRLALNSLIGALGAYEDVARGVQPRDPEALRALGRAVAEGHPEAAEAAARSLLEPDTHLFDP